MDKRPETLADLLAEAHAYVQLRAALGLRPDPLCRRLVAVRDALNMLPAIDSAENHRANQMILRTQARRASLSLVTKMEKP